MMKAVPFNQQDFEQLRSECLKSGKLFCDPTFPASSASLGKKEQGPGLEWKRPRELCDDPQFILDGATRTDVCQGSLSDCWLLAAMASLTLDPQILNRVVPPGQSFTSQYTGIFHFQLWQFGQWVDVVVDDQLPVKNNSLLYDRSGAKKEFWSALLEKAYAKVNGSYEALNFGYSTEAFEDFTGGISEFYDLKKAPPSLFNIIRKSLKLGALLSSFITKADMPEADSAKCKLVRSHEYSITGAEQVHYSGSLVELLRIRNPWGSTEWNGAWSDKSKEWDKVEPEEKKKLNYSAEDGEFWMSYNDFLLKYSSLEICNLTPDTLSSDQAESWYYAEFEGEWKVGSTAGGSSKYPEMFPSNPQFFFKLKHVDDEPHDGLDGCSVLISLMQKMSRKDQDKFNTIGFNIYKVPDEFKGGHYVRLGLNVLSKMKEAAKSKSNKEREVSERFKLPPGDYFIIPFTSKPNQEGSFILRMLTEKEAHTSGPASL